VIVEGNGEGGGERGLQSGWFSIYLVRRFTQNAPFHKTEGGCSVVVVERKM